MGRRTALVLRAYEVVGPAAATSFSGGRIEPQPGHFGLRWGRRFPCLPVWRSC